MPRSAIEASITWLMIRAGAHRVRTVISSGSSPSRRRLNFESVPRSSTRPCTEASSSQLTGAITTSALTSALTVSSPRFGGVSTTTTTERPLIGSKASARKPVAKVPGRAAVGQAGAERVPLAVAAPDGCVALAYEHLADRLRVVINR